MNQAPKNSVLKGMSLVEMIVAISILILGMQGFSMLFIRSFENNRFTLEEGVASAAASRVTTKVVDELRRVRQADNGDYPIESGSDFDLKVYLDEDNDGITERVHYYYQGNALWRGVTNPDTSTQPPTYPNGDQTTAVMTGYVVNANNEPIFTYYNKDYPSTVGNPISTPIRVENVRLIKVRLRVNIDPNKAPENINIENFAELRNLNQYAL